MIEKETGMAEAKIALFVHESHYINPIDVTDDLAEVPYRIKMISNQTLASHRARFISFQGSKHEQASFRPPSPGTATLRPYGLSSGQFTVPKDFDAPLPADLLDLYEGK